MAERRARDLALLDTLDAFERVPFQGEAWRIVRDGRNVLEGTPAGARWDPGVFDVLYTSLAREGALEEIWFHLSRQPVFPSQIRWGLHRVTVRAAAVLKLDDMAALERLGVTSEAYAGLAYARTQEIGDAAMFLGFDAILAPSARWDCHNLILFTERLAPDDLAVLASEPVDWQVWREERRAAKSM
jgi:RES domain-containing protein